MKIQENTVVTISYELSISKLDEEYEMVEVVDESNPLYYLHGKSGLPKAFEDHLVGLEVGQEFEFEIYDNQEYGEYSEEDIAEFSVDMFKIEDGKVPEGFLNEGNVIPFTNDDDSKINGRVLSVKDEVVLIDFNHPLAGRDMHFTGKVLKIREASTEEIQHGHVHGEGGVTH